MGLKRKDYTFLCNLVNLKKHRLRLWILELTVLRIPRTSPILFRCLQFYTQTSGFLTEKFLIKEAEINRFSFSNFQRVLCRKCYFQCKYLQKVWRSYRKKMRKSNRILFSEVFDQKLKPQKHISVVRFITSQSRVLQNEKTNKKPTFWI